MELGVYRGAAAPAAVEAYGRWLGAQPGVAVDFLGRSSWSEIGRPHWWVDGWAGSGYTVVYSVPLLPNSGGTLEEGARGAYNRHFEQLAQVLAEHGQEDAIVRPGWEMNGDWFPWSIAHGPELFASYWRRVVKAMRAVSPAFRFDFSVNMGSSRVGGRLLDPGAAYPGDDHVDFVGMDVYDRGSWESSLTMPFGLEWHRDFARAHGKPMSFPEWGLAGADSPEFVERMHDWLAQNDVAYHAYFEFDAPDGRHALMNGQFPVAARRFRELFGEA